MPQIPTSSVPGLLTRHPAIAAVLAVLACVIVGHAIVHGDAARAVVYLGTIAISAAAADLMLTRWPPVGGPPAVRNAGLEVGVLAISSLAALAWLCGRFVFNYQPQPGVARLVWLVLLLTCVFDLGLAVFFLARRYRPADLGVRLTGLTIAPVIVALFAVSSRVFFPTHVTWADLVRETGGTWWGVVVTAISAALPEEFFRFLWQTRVAAWLGSPATGWLGASVVWALLHAPVDWSQSHSLLATIMGVVNIIPLGLLWGYLTYRTRSFLPSMLIHGMNVWGLQNLA